MVQTSNHKEVLDAYNNGFDKNVGVSCYECYVARSISYEFPGVKVNIGNSYVFIDNYRYMISKDESDNMNHVNLCVSKSERFKVVLKRV